MVGLFFMAAHVCAWCTWVHVVLLRALQVLSDLVWAFGRELCSSIVNAWVREGECGRVDE